MLIQINTDGNIKGSERLFEKLEGVIRDAVDRFSEQITRVEVYLSDENSANKPGLDDKRCLLEARLTGLKPTSVSNEAATIELAVDGAVEKLMRSLDSTLGRLGR